MADQRRCHLQAEIVQSNEPDEFRRRHCSDLEASIRFASQILELESERESFVS
ncbi:uncharacterized protein G2W53_027683 [Senna tora]|uniref:Uncharacterized protein n=1 Tax=Senna tora TaxID=362788 RepID=A0A834WIM6_9FABA|nr:uncharacterized protein G2W53_027683 [Senna tora]